MSKLLATVDSYRRHKPDTWKKRIACTGLVGIGTLLHPAMSLRVRQVTKEDVLDYCKYVDAFLYSVIVGSNSQPVYKAVTNRHTADWLTQIFTQYMGDVKRSNKGTPITPQLVMTDFSHASTYALLNVFNQMNISEYSQYVFNIINGKVS